MIDPKFDKLPAEEQLEEGTEPATRKGQQTGPRRGLSINDTIAGPANLSVGARGVDTSGVISGAGAGAGQSFLSPGNPGESPAPEIAPGPRSSGTTPRGEVGTGQQPTINLDLRAETADLNYEEVARRAHECWLERGCPHGSPEVDWHRAEQELRESQSQRRTSAAAGGSSI